MPYTLSQLQAKYNQCKICDGTVRARGLCAKHYERWRVHGDPSFTFVRTPKNYIKDGIGYIELAGGTYAMCSPQDFDRVSRHLWSKNDEYARATIDKKNVKLHAFVMGVKGIDHIDNNGLNCQRWNLRTATQAQNVYNTRKRAGTSSRYKGVSWYHRSNKWKVQIGFRGKKYAIGYYHDEIDAAIVYNVAAQLFFGQFAHLNSI